MEVRGELTGPEGEHMESISQRLLSLLLACLSPATLSLFWVSPATLSLFCISPATLSLLFCISPATSSLLVVCISPVTLSLVFRQRPGVVVWWARTSLYVGRCGVAGAGKLDDSRRILVLLFVFASRMPPRPLTASLLKTSLLNAGILKAGLLKASSRQPP